MARAMLERALGRIGFGIWAAAALSAWSGRAAADTLIIERPGAHPNYVFEAEPHLLVGFLDPPGVARGSGIGAGFRGTIELVDNGFVKNINNTVGIGFGLDFIHYSSGHSHCVRTDQAGMCIEQRDDLAVDDLWLPVVMQWNFWLSRNWSVFGEPGTAIRYEASGGNGRLNLDYFQFYLGGRFHFADTAALTLRIGYPSAAVGVSFLL